MSKITKVRQVVNEMFGEKTCNYWVKSNNYIFLDKLSNGCRSLKVGSWKEEQYKECYDKLVEMGCEVCLKKHVNKENGFVQYRLWVKE